MLHSVMQICLFIYFLTVLIKSIWVSEVSDQMVTELSSVWFWFTGVIRSSVV